MKTRTLATYLAGLLTLLLLPVLLIAQEKPTYYLMHEDVVKPSKLAEWERDFKELNLLKKEYGYPFAHTTIFTTDYAFTSITPLERIADAEKMNDTWIAITEKAASQNPGDADKLTNLCSEAEHSHRMYFITDRQDLWYTPDDADYSEEGLNYRQIINFYTQRGKEAEAEEMMKAWKNLYQEQKVPYAYRVYQSSYGMEFGTFILVISAADPEDYYRRQKAMEQAAGEKAGQMWQEWLALLRRHEVKQGWFRPDLFYTPEATAGK